MRPIFSFATTFSAIPNSCQTPLIACADLDYDRQILPVDIYFDEGTRVPSTGEADMSQSRPEGMQENNRSTNQNQPETRQQRLARIRAEIEAGVYETPEKLEIALNRMLGVIGD